jgi:hypothetical protein
VSVSDCSYSHLIWLLQVLEEDIDNTRNRQIAELYGHNKAHAITHKHTHSKAVDVGVGNDMSDDIDDNIADIQTNFETQSHGHTHQSHTHSHAHSPTQTHPHPHTPSGKNTRHRNSVDSTTNDDDNASGISEITFNSSHNTHSHLSSSNKKNKQSSSVYTHMQRSALSPLPSSPTNKSVRSGNNNSYNNGGGDDNEDWENLGGSGEALDDDEDMVNRNTGDDDDDGASAHKQEVAKLHRRELIGAIIDDVLTHQDSSSSVSSVHSSGRTNGPSDLVSTLSGHLTYYPVKKNVVNPVFLNNNVRAVTAGTLHKQPKNRSNHANKHGSKSMKESGSNGTGSNDAAGMMEDTSSVGSSSIASSSMKDNMSTANSVVSSNASKVAAALAADQQARSVGVGGFVAVHRAQSALLNAEDFLAAATAHSLKQQQLQQQQAAAQSKPPKQPRNKTAGANASKDGDDSSLASSTASSTASKASSLKLLHANVQLPMVQTSRHGGVKHVKYNLANLQGSVSAAGLSLNSARDNNHSAGSSDEVQGSLQAHTHVHAAAPEPTPVPAPIVTQGHNREGPIGPGTATFLPTFHSTAAVASSPIHGSNPKHGLAHNTANITAAINRRTSSASPTSLLSAVGVSVTNSYHHTNTGSSGSASGSHHHSADGSSAVGHEYSMPSRSSFSDAFITPATNVAPIRSPYLDPRSKLNSVAISELKKEFFGR